MANEFIEIISEQTKKQINDIIPLVKELADQIKTINNFRPANTPSGADKNVQAMNAAYKERGETFKNLAGLIDRVATNQNNLTARTKQAVIAEDNLTKAIKKRFDAAEKEANSASAKKILQDREVTLKKLNELTKEATNLEEKRQNVLNKGYGSDKELNKIAKKFEDLNLRIKESSASLLKLDQQIHKTGDSSAVPKLQIVANRQKVDEKVAEQTEKEKIAAEKLIQANEKLNTAYNKLNKARTDAKNHLRDLIASEKASTAEINKAQKAFDILDQKVRKADRAVGDMSKNVGNYKSAFSGLSNLMGAFGIGTGIYLAVDVAKNIYETTKALQSLDLALKMVSGTQEEFASNQAFVTATAEKWGVEIKTLTEQYTYFYTAAKGLMSTAEIKTTFEGIAKAGAVMGLSLEKQSAAFYAFEQMMSKGIVTSEELKKQLGNSMPGAIRAAAMAYMDLHPAIKTIQEAEKMLLVEMKRGAIDSATYVPLIVKNLEKLYGIEMVTKVETLQAAQNRLKNSWTDLVRSMNESETGGLSKFFGVFAGGITNGLKILARYNTEWKKLHQLGREEGKAVGADFYKTEGKSKGKLKEDFDFMYAGSVKIAAKITELNKKFAKEGFFTEINPFSNTGEDIEKLNQELGQLEGAMQKISGILNPQEVKGNKPDNRRTIAVIDAEIKAEQERILQLSDTTGKEGLIIKKKIALLEAERDAIYNNNKAKKEAKRENIESVGTPTLSIAEDTALEKLKLLRDALEKTRDETAKNANEYKLWGEQIDIVNGAIDNFTKPLTTDITGELEAKVKPYNDKIKEAEENAIALKKAATEVFNLFAGDFADRLGFTDTFDFLLGEDKNGQTLFERLENDKANWEDYAIAVTTVMQDMYNFINQQSQARFDAEYKRLEEQKNVALQFAGDSTAAKEKIELDYERKRKEIARREAKAKKEQAMFNIAIDTAQAIMSVIAKGGKIWEGVAVGIMGAVQLAMVASQKIPQYWRGTENAEAGLAWTNERGAEIVTDKAGHILSSVCKLSIEKDKFPP